MLCGRCPISGELAEPWVADAECPELEAHFAHMVCACSMCVRLCVQTTPHWNWVEMPRETSISMMEMTSNHIPITQLHVSHFFVLEPPILPQSYATRITTCRCQAIGGGPTIVL